MAIRYFVALLLVSSAISHVSMWHASTFDSDRGNMNSDSNSQPLQDFTFANWWWHRNLNFPPDYTKPNTTFLLPANGVAVAEISSNKAFTSIGYRGFNQRDTPVPWNSTWSNIHAPARKDVAGCAWGISYKSNHLDVKPEDFVIFSVVHDCVARQVQPFKIPNLPACPNGRCMCSWFWIHKSIGGSDQMYMTPFACNVTGVRSDAVAVDFANAVAPRKCNNPADCTRGPRNPMYWKNLERNNMPEPGQFAPTYSILYGFNEGAQKDIFTTTNPRKGNVVKPFPTEVKCTKTAINPNGYGSRLVSNGLASLSNNLLFSPNCLVAANFQAGDGNLIVRNTSTGNVLWTPSFTGGQQPHTMSLASNGLLSAKDSTGKMVWSSLMTQGVGKAPYRLDLTNNGVLVMFDATGRNLWESWFFDNRESKYDPLAADPAVFNV